MTGESLDVRTTMQRTIDSLSGRIELLHAATYLTNERHRDLYAMAQARIALRFVIAMFCEQPRDAKGRFVKVEVK